MYAFAYMLFLFITAYTLYTVFVMCINIKRMLFNILGYMCVSACVHSELLCNLLNFSLGIGP